MLRNFLFSLLFVATTLNATISTKENVTKLYIATFNRAPDSTGLNYWVNCGLSLEDIAVSFFGQTETKTLYPDEFSNEDFVVTIYDNLFSRAPDSGGMDFWIGELESGRVSRSVFILAVLNGASGDDAKFLNNKTVVGLSFVDAQRDDINEANSIMNGVTREPDSVYRVLCNYSLAECDGSNLIDAPLQ
jgi:hypothetical protein